MRQHVTEHPLPFLTDDHRELRTRDFRVLGTRRDEGGHPEVIVEGLVDGEWVRGRMNTDPRSAR